MEIAREPRSPLSHLAATRQRGSSSSTTRAVVAAAGLTALLALGACALDSTAPDPRDAAYDASDDGATTGADASLGADAQRIREVGLGDNGDNGPLDGDLSLLDGAADLAADADCNSPLAGDAGRCPGPLEDFLLAPHSDPCDESAVPCKSAVIGAYTLTSTDESDRISTLVSDETGPVMVLDWVAAADGVDLIVTLPEHPALAPRRLAAALSGLEQANAAAALVMGLNATALSALGGLGAAAPAQSGNSAGCDQIDDWTLAFLRLRYPGFPWSKNPISCSKQGACCDAHDVCIDQHCTGNDSGNLGTCLKRDAVLGACTILCTGIKIPVDECLAACQAKRPICSPRCQSCHNAVIGCFLSKLPGKSQCCARGDCGMPQQCILRDEKPPIVATKPCECENRHLPLAQRCKPGAGKGGSSGDPHLVTFDRFAYDHQGVGEMILVRSLDDDFEVQARTKRWGRSRASINHAIAMRVAGDRIGIYLDRSPALYLNGVATPASELAPTLPGGGSIEAQGSRFIVTWPDATRVRVDSKGRYLNVRIQLPLARSGRVEGMLGDYDGNRGNDLRPREGVPIGERPSFEQFYRQFGDSWRILAEESLFDYLDGNSTETHTDRGFPRAFVTSAALEASVRKEAEAVCRQANITDPVLFEACVLDVGLTGDASFADAQVGVEAPLGALFVDDLLGYSEARPARSCLDIQQHGVPRGDGKYWVDLPDGVVQLHCDFSADTGGWTRVAALDTSANFCGNGAIADLRAEPDASMGRLPDGDVHALIRATPGSPAQLMYRAASDGRYMWHALETIEDYDTSKRHTSSQFYCRDWHCDNGAVDSSSCGSEGNGCPVTAHGTSGGHKKIYLDSSFSRHRRGLHLNGSMCGLSNYERAKAWIYVR